MADSGDTLRWLGTDLAKPLRIALFNSALDAIKEHGGDGLPDSFASAGGTGSTLAQSNVPDPTEISDKLGILGALYFNETFKYDYHTGTPPGSNAGKVWRLANLGSMGNPFDTYEFTDAFMKTVDIPSWMKSTMSNDLMVTARRLMNQSLTTSWTLDTYRNLFEASEETQRSVATNGVMIYLRCDQTGQLDVSTNRGIIYYMAIYHDVEPLKISNRKTLQTQAYRAAQDFTGDTAAISNDAQLEQALKRHATSQWPREFQYEYLSDNPKDFEDSQAAVLVRNIILKYLQEDELGRTEERIVRSIIDEFFGGINTRKDIDTDENKVKDYGIKAWVEEDLLAKILSVVSQPPSKEWAHGKLNNTYEPIDPGLNGIRANIIFYFYHDKQTAEGVEVIYLYIQGIFYDVESPSKKEIREMYEKACEIARSQVRNYEPLPGEPPGSPNQLRNILFQLAKQEFKTDIGFEWRRDLLPEDIPNPNSPMVPVVYSVLFDFTAARPTREEIEKRVAVVTFPKDGTSSGVLLFPWGEPFPVQEALFDEICNDLERAVRATPFRGWGSIDKFRYVWLFRDDPESPVHIRHYSMVIFHRPSGAENFFAYYLTVFAGNREE